MAQAEQALLADMADMADRLRVQCGDPAPPPWRAALSARDMRVLRLLSDGWGTAGIAEELAYSESTIKNVIRDLVHQLGARNRAHAVAMAIRAGVI